jgi:Fibronectin type III domain
VDTIIRRARRLLPLTVIPALAAAAALAPAAAASAAAFTTTAATTQVSDHPDTTTGAVRQSCTASPNGATWARDTYASTLIAVPTGSGTWRVTLEDSGRFAGFADPGSCAASLSDGTLTGLYTVSVTSPVAPDPSKLHSSYSGDVSTTQMITDFFDDASGLVISGGDYFFVYQDGAYVQTTASIYGDVDANGGTVTGLKASSVTASSAKLSWNAVNGATGYAVRVVAPAAGPVHVTAGTSITLSGLAAHTRYTVYVTAEPSASGHAAVTFTTA